VTFRTIEMTEEGALAVVRLNRPSQYNALDDTMAAELLAAARHVHVTPGLRAMILTGSGNAFCGGGDVKAFAQAGERVPAFIESVVTPFHLFVTQMVRMGKPTVAAVNGVAAGGGFSLAMTCDLVIAQESAYFTSGYSKIGASPDGSMSFFLPRMIGARRTLELYLTNRNLSAQEALEWGLVTQVVPAAGLMAEARKLAEELAAGPTLAYGRARELIYESLDHSLETQLELEARGIIASSRTEDFRNATRAFVEKRKPAYAGR
jgi:2-(1,2-epoxy-1,2-dihydrophenyl)acetyl-CoA isomerase